MTIPASPLLSVRGLTKHFGPPKRLVRAVEDVALDIAAGETVGLVGESGSGKSTIGRVILRLAEPTRGEIWWEGQDIVPLKPGAMRELRRHMQIIFQDPAGALDPRLNVSAIIAEPLQSYGVGAAAAQTARVRELLQLVGLPAEAANGYPHEFSGGQQQRIGIARALALSPRLIVCDEPLSALDLSVQAQILTLLTDVQRQFGISYLFISHNLGVVRRIASRVVVLYLGRVVEAGSTARVFERPSHPYTQSLLAAVPSLDPDLRRERPILPGEMPSPISPPGGCAFHPRCPIAVDRCKTERPALRALDEGRQVACHLAA